MRQVAAVGVNCTAPQHIESLVEIAALRTAKPIVVYPNSGECYDAAAMCWHGGAAATTLAKHAREWHRLGARLIGGCCRTTPAEIRALRTWAAQRNAYPIRARGPPNIGCPDKKPSMRGVACLAGMRSRRDTSWVFDAGMP